MKFSSFFKSIVFGVPIGVAFFDTVGYIARVDGISMQPTLNPDRKTTDYIFLSKWAVRSLDNLYRGDIISLVSPKDPKLVLIKRIIGVEGDTIHTISYKQSVIKVPEGHCWVEGDHTGHSLDSNLFGPVSLGLITAKAAYIVWPPARWQYIKSDLPSDRIPVNISKTI